METLLTEKARRVIDTEIKQKRTDEHSLNGERSGVLPRQYGFPLTTWTLEGSKPKTDRVFYSAFIVVLKSEFLV